MRPGRKPFDQRLIRKGKALGQVLKELREDSGKTQEDLARVAGISLEALRRIERSATINPGFFTVVDLSSALEIDLSGLAQKVRSIEGRLLVDEGG